MQIKINKLIRALDTLRVFATVSVETNEWPAHEGCHRGAARPGRARHPGHRLRRLRSADPLRCDLLRTLYRPNVGRFAGGENRLRRMPWEKQRMNQYLPLCYNVARHI